MADAKPETTPEAVLSIYQNYKKECDTAFTDRKKLNKDNFDMYHLRQDFSAKQAGQSREVLPKVAMAVEQNASFLQQGLIDMGAWFKILPATGLSEDIMKVKPKEMHALLKCQLEKAGFMTTVGDAAKNGFLAAKMIVKVHGKMVPKYKYKAETKQVNGSFKRKLVKVEDKKWQLAIDLIQPGDYRKDPTNGQYEMQDIYMDYYQVEALAKGKDAIYDLKVVQQIQASASQPETDRTAERARETGQNIPMNGFRKQVKVTEIWGNFIDSDGNLVYENCVCTIANDQYVIQPPTDNKLWHGESPFCEVSLITVPGSTQGKALMDAGVAINRATNEFFNLILDGGIGSVHGIKQVREHWLEDPAQIENGIPQGETLRVNTACPPGMQVLERVDTSNVPQEAISIYNLLVQEGNVAMMTSDFRMGAQSQRAVKATQIVESSNAIDSLLGGIAKRIEQDWIVHILRKAWACMAQHIDQMDEAELKAAFGEKRAAAILQMGPEQLFADTVDGYRAEVFGISSTLNKMKDFTKLTAVLQTISSNPQLYEEFLKKNDLGKFLEEILASLDINVNKIRADEHQETTGNPAQEAAVDQLQGQQGQADTQSQIPQAGAASQQADLNPINSANFPPSKATPSA